MHSIVVSCYEEIIIHVYNNYTFRPYRQLAVLDAAHCYDVASSVVSVRKRDVN